MSSLRASVVTSKPVFIASFFDATVCTQSGFKSNTVSDVQLTNYTGMNNITDISNPFNFDPQYLARAFSSAVSEELCAPLKTLSESTQQPVCHQQLRGLISNQTNSYEGINKSVASKGKRLERIRMVKPLTWEELEHDESRLGRVARALVSVEDHANRTVDKIAKKFHEMYPDRYPDFKTVVVCVLMS